MASRLLIHDVSDVVVRIRPGPPLLITTAADGSSGGGQLAASSLVDVRSRSRDRTRDFGANAANIDRLAQRLAR